MDSQDRIEQFTATLSGNLLAADDFIDWDAVSQNLRLRAKEARELQEIVDSGPLTRERLFSGLSQHPRCYTIMLDLLAFSSSGTQVEKWGLPSEVEPSRLDWLVGQLLYIGIDKMLAPGTNVGASLQVAEVYKDANRRRFRGGKKLDERVRLLVRNAVSQANEHLEEKLSFDGSGLSDAGLRRALSYVISVGKRPLLGFATVFQNQSGGRQLRDLAYTYPNLQQRLSEHGIALVLIADGQGLKEASDRTLGLLFEGVRYPINLTQAADGGLRDALIEVATAERPEAADQAALNRLIEDRLRLALSVEAEALPVGPNRARLALSAYADARRRAFLVLSPTGERLSWGNASWVEAARRLKVQFNPKAALDLFAEMLGCEVLSESALPTELCAEMVAPPVAPFGETLHITVSRQPLDEAQAREVGRRSSEMTPYSNLAIYLTPHPISDSQITQHRKAQSMLAANVIGISASALEQMATNREPLNRLMDAILTQSDLTKVSPFILSNPTTDRMFYGREAEAATVQRTLATNSVAILGSRRIGKTSLIRRLRENLRISNFQPFFADCQTVKTWHDFAELARKSWQVSLPQDFRPLHLSLLIEELQGRGEGPVVVILDEIDQLIEWDQNHSDDTVPEAFFRSCRSISQAGAAQFVFSGERRIANRLWDAQSPHWNFCRPVQLTQLGRTDAASLLIDPLRSMGVKLPDQASAAELAWERTSGHPQIVQYLGDRLVRLLNAREDRRDLAVSSNDIAEVTSTTEYAQHYLTTYWGQATKFEKAVSEIVAASEGTPVEVLGRLRELGIEADSEALLSALRMLQLYGIIADVDEKIALRATWFPDALAHFGSLSVQ
ncbi:hypothetical protein HNP52_004281 [Sphingomonas kyeonggiensis]|uniref:AAA+ ATPase domain-containing protein n=1 Tax=Sphingomonas kyeonggiensis TaxID=1268553 RepID=A0A7W7K522_9SPHN|nr:DpnII family type II restriction endonuclease [Sphingomonas kyeonggiensis]MBB4841184.1 hypothetical protein [Sphingomonas kyeonggiensis]